MRLNVDRKLTILIALWILDKLIMLSMFIFFNSSKLSMFKYIVLLADGKEDINVE